MISLDFTFKQDKFPPGYSHLVCLLSIICRIVNVLIFSQSNGGSGSIGGIERPGGHVHNPNVGGQIGAGPGGSNAMSAAVSAPPPEFEMKGNDFPALPGIVCY